MTEEDLRKNISIFFSSAHTKVVELADKMYRELKRTYYITPSNYIGNLNFFLILF